MTRTLRTRAILGLAASVMVLALACALSLAFGARPVPLPQVFGALVHPDPHDIADLAVLSRIPTTVAGIVVGGALGIGGALMQGISRNPLADPGLLGINSGASLFVVVGMTFFGITSALGTVWFAFGGAAIAVIVVYGAASAGRRGATPLSLALAGAAVAAAATSITSGLLITQTDVLDSFRFWQIGSISAPSLATIGMVLPFMIAGAVLGVTRGNALNALALGDDVARALGRRVTLDRILAAVAVVLLCGAATAAAGPIGFVGLAVPHAARLVAGADYRWILPYSAVLGGAFLLVCDVVGRLVARPSTIEVGVVVAVVGAPIFIALVRRRKLVAL